MRDWEEVTVAVAYSEKKNDKQYEYGITESPYSSTSKISASVFLERACTSNNCTNTTNNRAGIK